MTKEKLTSIVDDIVENKSKREEYIDRIEVLDKVKDLFLIPQLEMMTLRQIAEFYKVDINTARLCYQRNKKEIDSDGTIVENVRDFAEFSNGTSCTIRKEGKVNILEYEADGNKIQVVVSNRGVRCFSKRAVLRFGMLLRDSEVAQEVRNQLLNIKENAEKENPETVTAEINKERELLSNIGVAYGTGDFAKLMQATQALDDYRNRHIKVLTEKNKVLKSDNHALACDILKWSDKSSANRLVRTVANKVGVSYGALWNKIYTELEYRHHINLKLRKAKAGNEGTIISYIKDDEWKCFYKTVAAMLTEYKISPSEMFREAKILFEVNDM